MDFVGVEALHALTDRRHSLDEMRRLWRESPPLRRFETGRCTAMEFARDFVKEWDLDMDPSALLAEFETWSRAPFEGALDLLGALDGRYKLACLTNMNEAYWHRNRDEMGFGRIFHRCYASHEIGLLKPDPRLYDHVVKDLACPPEAIAFFDDTAVNIEAAESFGLSAHLVDGIEALKNCLSSLGITAAKHP